MNNKAFTLIELIAIISVLVIIFLISFPNLMDTTKKSQDKLYEQMKKDLCLAGKSYIYSNLDKYQISIATSDGSNLTTFKIKVQTLIEYGNVEKDLKNPKTKKSVSDNYLKFTVLDDDSLECVFVE